uniref:Uncharacterized protein n=1 Tax=Arundo donax TaxID=35708 RepID=A0A0A9CRA3_ARUDO
MPRSPRPPRPAPAEAAPGGGDEDEEEFEICNYDGFVYKRARGLYPDVAPSSAQAAAGPDPEVARRRRRRSALLRLRAKRIRELSRWETLAYNLDVPPPAPRQPPPQSPPASTRPADSNSILDGLLGQAEVQAELLNKVSQMCDQIQILCDAQEAAVVDDIAALPVWGNPKHLIKALCDSPDEQTAPGTT